MLYNGFRSKDSEGQKRGVNVAEIIRDSALLAGMGRLLIWIQPSLLNNVSISSCIPSSRLIFLYKYPSLHLRLSLKLSEDNLLQFGGKITLHKKSGRSLVENNFLMTSQK